MEDGQTESMGLLFDHKDASPQPLVLELFGKAIFDAFKTIRADWYGEGLSLEPKL